MVHYWGQLKSSKLLLSAGKYDAALKAAEHIRRTTNNPHLAAMALHRIAMALSRLGRTESACAAFQASIQEFEAFDSPDLLGLSIVRRDYELHCVQRLGLTAQNPEDSKKRLELICDDLALLDTTDRVEFERVVTRAFVNRVDMMVHGDTLQTRRKLREDWQQIRALRGDKKPMYELDALDWLLRYERPVIPNALVRRRLALALEVRNPIYITASVLTPPVNAATKVFSWKFG